MKHYHRLLAIILLLLLSNKTVNTQTNKYETKKQTLAYVQQPAKTFVVSKKTTKKANIRKLLIGSFETAKHLRIKALEHEINQIDVANIRKIYNKENALDSIRTYFPRYKNVEKVKNISGLISIIRLEAVWNYIAIKYNVPKYVPISFYIYETTWGKSELFQLYYNIGGMKRTTEAKYALYKDDCGEEKCKFKVFDTLLDGIDCWGRILALKRYTDHYAFDDPYEKVLKAYDVNKNKRRGNYWSSKRGYINRINVIEKLELYNV